MKRIYPHIVILTFTAAMVLTGCGKKQETAPPVVLVAEAVQADAPVFSEAVASLDGSTNIPIHSQVSGYLIKQAYQEGSAVKAGDLLFLIDTRPFQADPTAKSDSGYTRITSPIAGIAGRAIPGVGDLVSPGMTLTTVATVDPIAAAFALPKKIYADNPGQMAQAGIELLRADGTLYPQKGRFDHIERPARTSTGMITVYALFPNPDDEWRPGQYAKVRGAPRRIEGAVLIPQRAVNELQGIDQVMVVKPDNTVEVRNVTTGARAGSFQIITSGLKTGERVVVEGVQKCQEGSPVTPQPYVAPPGATSAK